MRASQWFTATMRQTPNDAEIISHQLMLRAGMIRKLGSGLYNWLPLGLKILRKVETIVREEMHQAQALEILMPALQPKEIWDKRIGSFISKRDLIADGAGIIVAIIIIVIGN